ncbi:MAG TPA: chorismate-binding protein [Thermoanaerobaculia bacterium]|nr:chorismate-binding protein [Thermoanaerobaculia bacterium]
MWSDRLPPARRARLIARLRSVLPAPRPGSRGATTPLRRRASPEQVAAELCSRPGFVWLDGADPRLAASPRALLTARGGRATVHGPGGRVTFTARGLDLLEAALAAWGSAATGDDGGDRPGHHGLLIGYLGYELGGEVEALPPAPPDDLGLPDLWLGLYDAVLHRSQKGWVLESTDAWLGVPGLDPASLPTPLGDGKVADPVLAAERLLERAARRPAEEVPDGPLTRGPLVSRPHRSGFEAAVAAAVRRIESGEIFQVNLCRRLEAPLSPADLWPLYLRLRAASPAAHGAFFDLGPERPGRRTQSAVVSGVSDASDASDDAAGPRRALLSVSPEQFLTVRGGEVTSRPIKGTRPRGRTPRDDRALEKELLASAKDCAELAMIVDVVRNDLGRVCATGSVAVPQLREVLRLPTVLHTVATVTGRLRDDAGAADLLRAAFPPASITGAPKIQSMTVAAELEERRRGPAMGAFGWIALAGGPAGQGGGDLDLAVAIRTAVAARGRVAYHAGCGITADSDPEDEFDESAVKASAFLTALGREPG